MSLNAQKFSGEGQTPSL